MSDQVVLKADPRSESGKQVAKRLRAEGKLPAVVYGEQDDAVACAIDRKVFETLLHDHGRNAIITLETGGKTQSTIVKDLQHHPLRGGILHVDFHRINLTQQIVVEVSVEAKGSPAGVRNEGGILEQMLYLVEIECLPTDIPDSIVVDVSALGIGDSIHVSDISVDGSKFTIVTDGDRTIFSVAPPTVAVEEEEEGEEDIEEEEEMQEPELIERGKKDEDEDEGES